MKHGINTEKKIAKGVFLSSVLNLCSIRGYLGGLHRWKRLDLSEIERIGHCGKSPAGFAFLSCLVLRQFMKLG
jgi:hypothetical protein